MRGTIPEKVTYIFNSSYISTSSTDSEEEKCIPAFVSNAKSKTCKQTGKRWANHRKYNYQTQTYSDNGEVIEFTLPNTPLKNLKIRGYDKTYHGASAWKVIVPVEGHNFYMDLREDSLKDAILNAGIQTGGVLNGEWIWAVVGSERKLTRVGSEAYENYKVNSTRKTMKEIKKDFEKGAVYKNISNESWVYLGKVNFLRKVIDSNHYLESNFHFEKHKDVDLWANLKNNRLDDISYYNLRFGKTPKLYQKVEQLEISPNYIEDLRNLIVLEVHNYAYYVEHLVMQDASIPNKPLSSLNLSSSLLNEFTSNGIDVNNVIF